MEGQDHLKELYNVKDPPARKDQQIGRENTIATRTEIASLFKRYIHKDHSPWILPMKGFFAQSLFFSLLSYHIWFTVRVVDPLNPSF